MITVAVIYFNELFRLRTLNNHQIFWMLYISREIIHVNIIFSYSREFKIVIRYLKMRIGFYSFVILSDISKI